MLKKLKIFGIIFIVAICLSVTNVNAGNEETYSDEFKKITTDGNLTIDGFKPDSIETATFLITNAISDLIDTDVYYASAHCWETQTVDKATISLYSSELGVDETHVVNMIYNEPDSTIRSKVNSVVSKIKTFESIEDITPTNAYRLEDLYLINFLNTNSKTNFSEEGANSNALNFAKELINEIDGGNIYFKFFPMAGEETSTGLFQFSLGPATIYYNGVAYTLVNTAITQNNVLYISDDTENTTAAYAAAALKRITDYLGTTEGINVTYGGTLESLNYNEQQYGEIPGGGFGPIGEVLVTYNDNELIDEEASDGNYYNVTILGKTYRFAICKKSSSELETPKYLGSDLLSNILIKSDATVIPLDTSLSVREVEDGDIEDKIGTSVYAAYDISLYSKFKKASITKLANGKFTVSIPVPESLEGKEIIVYYITSTGKKEEHLATVKDKIASFETDHFSTYILAEKPAEEKLDAEIEEDKKDETPKTGNDIIACTAIIVTVLGISGIIMLKRK